MKLRFRLWLFVVFWSGCHVKFALAPLVDSRGGIGGEARFTLGFNIPIGPRNAGDLANELKNAVDLGNELPILNILPYASVGAGGLWRPRDGGNMLSSIVGGIDFAAGARPNRRAHVRVGAFGGLRYAGSSGWGGTGGLRAAVPIALRGPYVFRGFGSEFPICSSICIGPELSAELASDRGLIGFFSAGVSLEIDWNLIAN